MSLAYFQTLGCLNDSQNSSLTQKLEICQNRKCKVHVVKGELINMTLPRDKEKQFTFHTHFIAEGKKIHHLFT